MGQGAGEDSACEHDPPDASPCRSNSSLIQCGTQPDRQGDASFALSPGGPTRGVTAPPAHTPQHAAVDPTVRLPQSVERPFDEHHGNEHRATSDHQSALLTILPHGQVHDAVAGILDEANIEENIADISTEVGVRNLVD